MSWIVLEGIDRSGKSTVADFYKEQGYEIHHMDAPSKKFSEPGYVGPSYLDECMETYIHFDGKNIVFDRSVYGETVWPDVYGRKSQLSSEDLEVLREYEENNDAEYVFMSDPDFEAHWQRCVANKEPLNRNQFNVAVALYEKLETRFSFEKKQLSDYKELSKEEPKAEEIKEGVVIKAADNKKSIHQLKLEEANAINSLLSSRIVKKKGSAFDIIESSIRDHLQGKLSNIFGNNDNKSNLTNEEVVIIKQYVKQLKQKLEARNGR